MPLENTEEAYKNIDLSSKTNANIGTIDTDFTKINQDKNDLSTATGKLFEYKDNQKSFGTMSDIINPTNSTTNQQYQNNQIKMQQPKEQTKLQNFDDFNKQFADNNQMSKQDFSTFNTQKSNTQKNKIPTFGNMSNFNPNNYSQGVKSAYAVTRTKGLMPADERVSQMTPTQAQNYFKENNVHNFKVGDNSFVYLDREYGQYRGYGNMSKVQEFETQVKQNSEYKQKQRDDFINNGLRDNTLDVSSMNGTDVNRYKNYVMANGTPEQKDAMMRNMKQMNIGVDYNKESGIGDRIGMQMVPQESDKINGLAKNGYATKIGDEYYVYDKNTNTMYPHDDSRFTPLDMLDKVGATIDYALPTAGGFIGGAVSGASTLGVGSISGGMIGAGAGTVLADSTKSLLGNSLGFNDTRSPYDKAIGTANNVKDNLIVSAKGGVGGLIGKRAINTTDKYANTDLGNYPYLKRFANDDKFAYDAGDIGNGLKEYLKKLLE